MKRNNTFLTDIFATIKKIWVLPDNGNRRIPSPRQGKGPGAPSGVLGPPIRTASRRTSVAEQEDSARNGSAPAVRAAHGVRLLITAGACT